ncbi:hypothetical protein PMZ80_000252 [Knufia obscura]|uniref:Protein kinase domain-containing protein n=1 Tax=Knufia obscura TaxID=1635080 RepID=A0ABR0RZR7_9EURO|nr:hypothetical protein PMZ80_000252 [Knufia obscura]
MSHGMWPQQRRAVGRAAHLRRRDLTQLYNDAKVSYENTIGSRTRPANTDYDNDPEVLALRKEFQEQQDRLLAWGIHWADKQASSGGGGGNAKGKEAGADVEIDEKIDEAGLGEVVAAIMENIRSTLAQSGQLQHPDRWKENRGPPGGGGGAWAAFKSGMAREKIGMGGASPRAEKPKEWKDYELTTGRELLGKLKESIDLLYALDSSQEDVVTTGKLAKEEAASSHALPPLPASLPRHVGVDDALNTKEQAQVAHHLLNHSLYIDFTRLEPMHDPNAAAEPPSYEEAKENTQAIQAKSVYFYPAMQTHVLVDLARARSYPVTVPGDDPLQQAHEISQLVSGKGLLTWDGHLKLLGFTLAHASSRFGLVYALPAPQDPTALQACQTLTTSINATLEHETSFPPLENKFRLGYNIALNATSYLAHGHCHGHIKSSNIIFLRENDNPKLGKTLRCPYILQPVQKLVGEPNTVQPLRDTVYHHTGADEVGYGVVPAYDVFSIGLILLEIGLWRPLPSFWKPKYDRALFHDRLQKYYVPKLASKCGTRYMNLVKRCFEAPDELQDKTSPIDAAEYLLDIVEDLCRCCAVDEAGPPSELDIEVYESLIGSQRLEHPESSKSAAPAPTLPVPVPQARPSQAKKPSAQSKSKQKSADALKKWPNLDIPQDHLETWENMLMPRFSKMLKNALKDSMESCSVNLMMIGSTPEKAKTTICVQCRDTAKVRDFLCQRFKPKSGWGLVVCGGDVRRSGQIARKSTKSSTNARRSGGDVGMPHNNDEKPREQLYQPWPGCGASIGAWTNETHLPPVSFGGTIIVDGTPYGMTVHHMLDDPDDAEAINEQADPEAPTRSTAPRSSQRMPDMEGDSRFMASEQDLHMTDAMDELNLYDDDEMAETSDEDSLSDAESDASTIRPDFVMMGDDGDDFFIMADDDDEDEPPDLEDDEDGHSSEESDGEAAETGSIGDTPGVSADRWDDEDFCITQPAWDDVPENFFSDDPEYRDEEHLLSHSFGLVHASSGLKRMTKLNMKHEIDWALIRINERRLNLTVNPEAAVASRQSSRSSKLRKRKDSSMGGAKFTEPPLTAITPMTSMPKMPVSCVGRTSGRQAGRISQAMSLLKLPGRTSFSVSFTVEGGMGIPGDSGAWVYNEERKELCGHILAWSDSMNLAYIVPMEVLFDDLKERLGAKEVRLPAAIPHAPWTSPCQIQQASASAITTIHERAKPAQIIEDNKENVPAAQLQSKLQQLQLNTNTDTGAIDRVYNTTTTNRPSSKTSHHDETSSPVSASSASARRCRADTVPRTQSPTQLPTPPGSGTVDARCMRKDVYGYEPGKGKKCVGAVTRAVPS